MDYVRDGVAARNPLKTVFLREPTTQEYQKILAALPDDGRQAVSTAMQMFNSYAAQVVNSKGIGIKPNFGRQTTTSVVVPSLEQIRARVYGAGPATLDEIRRLAVGLRGMMPTTPSWASRTMRQ